LRAGLQGNNKKGVAEFESRESRRRCTWHVETPLSIVMVSFRQSVQRTEPADAANLPARRRCESEQHQSEWHHGQRREPSGHDTHSKLLVNVPAAHLHEQAPQRMK
jgi:hypothetical protein